MADNEQLPPPQPPQQQPPLDQQPDASALPATTVRREEEPLRKTVSSLSQFGTRVLANEDDVYNYNAWDNVEWDSEQETEALEKIAAQALKKVPDDLQIKYHDEAPQMWDQFYTNNQNRFFKDRHWLRTEFPELFENLPRDQSARFDVFEIGCGAGNTVFPLMAEAADTNVYIHACDYSKVAVEVVKSNPAYDEQKCRAFVYDITSATPPPEIEPGSIDVCICIFVLSAIHPNSWRTAVRNIHSVLKPGGLLLFRDYGRYDLAQLRLKGGRMLQDNFYIRGDKTRVYFFTTEEIAEMFTEDGKFVVEQNAVDRRLIVNRARQLKMYRQWVQGKFRKAA
ncbi:hypothetical protein HDU86_003534 [Geranomyces michiganensis]|nr:hypothetical protein HDU86_003534 [Geranomyces michiganensis]